MGAVLLAIGIGLAAPQAASAAKTVSAKCSTLQATINSAVSGEVIKLTALCKGQSFTIANSNPFTLMGAKTNRNRTPADGFNGNSGSSAALSSSTNVHITIANLLFENATTAGCTNNTCNADGPAVQFLGNSAVTIKSDRFIRNTASLTTRSGLGGAVAIYNGTATNSITIASSTFIGNKSGDGGALYVNSMGPIHLTGDVFTGNTVPAGAAAYYPNGGAVDLENYWGYSKSPVTVIGNTFGGTAKGAGNSAPGWGGALVAVLSGPQSASQPGQPLTLKRNKFIDNSVTGGAASDHVGGAVAFQPATSTPAGFNTVVQSGNLFQGNSVGGVNPNPSTNVAGGGAEWGTAMSIKSSQDRFIANKVTELSNAPAPEGGAVGVLGYSSSLDISSYFTGADDLFLKNSVTGPNAWGGAIYTGGAGGIDCNNGTSTPCPPSHLKLFDSTLSGNVVNSSSGQGAAIWGGPQDTLAMDNSIVFGNKGPAGAPEIFGYTKPSYSHDDACTKAGGTKALTGSGDICQNPKLAATGAETSLSPTIDMGLNSLIPHGLTKDLAGHPRTTEGRATTCRAIVDMGAFESPAVACKR